MADQKFCTNCGTKLSEGARFCASCGQPVGGNVQAAPVQAAEQIINPPPVSNENIIGVTTGINRKKGLFKTESFSVVVTDKRIIFALLNNEILKEQAAQMKGGFLSRLGSSMSGDYITKRYLEISPDQALSENPENFAVNRGEIKKVKLQEGSYDDDSARHSDGKLEIHTVRDKLSFNVTDRFYDATRKLFKTAGLV